jgi:hypothetical protein
MFKKLFFAKSITTGIIPMNYVRFFASYTALSMDSNPKDTDINLNIKKKTIRLG